MTEKENSGNRSEEFYPPQDENQLIARIIDANKPIALFLGAGISSPIIPKWDNLVSELLSRSLVTYLGKNSCSYDNLESLLWWAENNLDKYGRGNIIKEALGERYSALFHDILYERYDPALLTKGNLMLPAIAMLCLNRKTVAVFTYNYDNLLEMNIDKKRKKRNYRDYVVIHKNRIPTLTKGELPIYHVHGYLPWLSPKLSSLDQDIVFSLEEYHNFMRESASWHTTAQLYHFQHSTCIFLGASLTDVNMLRLLSTARKYSHNRDIYQIMSTDGDVLKSLSYANYSNQEFTLQIGKSPILNQENTNLSLNSQCSLKNNTWGEIKLTPKSAIMLNQNAKMMIMGKHFATMNANLVLIPKRDDIPKFIYTLCERLKNKRKHEESILQGSDNGTNTKRN